MYTTKQLTAKIDVGTYLRDFVNVEEFLECCKECPNYGKVWSCPPYDFNVEEYWRQYKEIEFFGVRIEFDDEVKTGSWEEVYDSIVTVEKQKLTEMLYEKEKEVPGSISLSAGSCRLCKSCARLCDKPCVNKENMRYSIESLGGNVGKTCTKILKQELLWCEEGKMPDHFILVCALLKK